MAWYTPALDFYLQIRKDRIEGHKTKSISGMNTDTGTSWSPVWSLAQEIFYPSSAQVCKVSSSNVNDTSTGTGARTVTIMGLDGDFAEISETVTLNGQTSVNTQNSYLRINSLKVSTSGSNGSNKGSVYIGSGTVTAGVPTDVINIINPGDNLSKRAAITIPQHYKAFKIDFFYSNGSVSYPAKFIQKLRPLEGLWYKSGVITVPSANTIRFENKALSGYSAGTDIEFISKLTGSEANSETTVFVEYIYADIRSG